jgi:hypothetical protein
VIFTTPQSPKHSRVQRTVPSDAVTQLLSLGYLAPQSSPATEAPAAAHVEAPDHTLAAGQIRIDHVE